MEITSILNKYVDELLKPLRGYYFYLGVISESLAERKPPSNKNISEYAKNNKVDLNRAREVLMKRYQDSVQAGITNAQILFINELGSPMRGIPSRPVLEITAKHAEREMLAKGIQKALNTYMISYNISDYEKELKRLGMRIQSYARNIIYDNAGVLAPNSPRTIEQKGENYPLHDTGQLARSITCILMKEGKFI